MQINYFSCGIFYIRFIITNNYIMLTTIVLLMEKIINITLIIIVLLLIYYILNILKQLCFEIQNSRMSWILSGAINLSVITYYNCIS